MGEEIKLDLSRRRLYAHLVCVTAGAMAWMSMRGGFWFGLFFLVWDVCHVIFDIKNSWVKFSEGEIEIRRWPRKAVKVKMDKIVRIYIRQGTTMKIMDIKSLIMQIEYEPNNSDWWWRMGFTSGAYGYWRNRVQMGDYLEYYKDFLSIPGVPSFRVNEYLEKLDELAGRKIERVDMKTGYPLQWDAKWKRTRWL